ncbi:hypothetical protein D9M68_951370 [compost metagenome]
MAVTIVVIGEYRFCIDFYRNRRTGKIFAIDSGTECAEFSFHVSDHQVFYFK